MNDFYWFDSPYEYLAHIAVGDAYGAAFEFVKDKKWIKEHNDLRYHAHPDSLNPNPGAYTDDTQMSMAIARHIKDGGLVNQYHIANYFLLEYQRNPIRGYARGFQTLLDTCVLSLPKKASFQIALDSFVCSIKPASKRNGSVMRSVPVGTLPTVDEVLHYSCVQSSITHADIEVIRAASAVAMAAHHFNVRKSTKRKLVPFLFRHGLDLGFDFKYKRVPCEAIITAKTAIKLVLDYDNQKDMLLKAISIGGDTDSVASVAMGLASMCREIDQNLPDALFENNIIMEEKFC